MPEVLDIPADRREDPLFARTEGREIGRDGCRVPLPWTADAATSFGFSPSTHDEPWLPLPGHWGRHAADRQAGDPSSTLALLPVRAGGTAARLDAAAPSNGCCPDSDELVAYRRGDVLVVLNVSDHAVALPAGSLRRHAGGRLVGARAFRRRLRAGQLVHLAALEDDLGRSTWWRHAVIYQVYIRSFADGDGDGLGDIAGLRSTARPTSSTSASTRSGSTRGTRRPRPTRLRRRLPTSRSNRRFGTMADGRGARGRGARARAPRHPRHRAQPHVDRHAWFQAALAAGAGLGRARTIHLPRREGRARRTSAERLAELLRWLRVDARGRARRRARPVVPAPVRSRAARPQLGAPRHARRVRDVRCASGSTVGSTGSASTWRTRCSRPTACPTSATSSTTSTTHGEHPFCDLDGVHEVYRSWRRIADSYRRRACSWPRRGCRDPTRLARYVRSDELHTTFNFDLPARAVACRRTCVG